MVLRGIGTSIRPRSSTRPTRRDPAPLKNCEQHVIRIGWIFDTVRHLVEFFGLGPLGALDGTVQFGELLLLRGSGSDF